MVTAAVSLADRVVDSSDAQADLQPALARGLQRAEPSGVGWSGSNNVSWDFSKL